MPWLGSINTQGQDSNPMLLEDVTMAFPDFQFVNARPSWPWQDEALSLALHQPNE